MTVMRRAGVLGFGIAALVAVGSGEASAQSSPPPTVLQVLGVEVTRPAPPATLPRTGNNMDVAYVGAGLAGVGVVLVVAARRRQKPAAG
jgi:LPXTG-motif cell wall-anchored protein